MTCVALTAKGGAYIDKEAQTCLMEHYMQGSLYWNIILLPSDRPFLEWTSDQSNTCKDQNRKNVAFTVPVSLKYYFDDIVIMKI